MHPRMIRDRALALWSNMDVGDLFLVRMVFPFRMSRMMSMIDTISIAVRAARAIASWPW